jgi:hypothetical protein
VERVTKTSLYARVERLAKKTGKRYVLDKDLTGYRLQLLSTHSPARGDLVNISPRLNGTMMNIFLLGMGV